MDLEIPIALKVLRPEFAGRPDAESRFRREATTAARLRHPNIVTVRDVGSNEGVVYVAMDLLPLSLARRLDILDRLPETEVVRVGIDVAGALAMAHAEGVVHRDIKPDNVLLSATGDAIVADFGLARALSGDPSLSEANQVLGTPHYFSPEQARSQAVDGRTDLYSLGVTLYRASTGHLPFEGDDWYAVARQHIEAKVTPLREHVPELSPEFEAVVMRLLAKRPDERFETATQLADALLVLPSAPVRRVGVGTPVNGGDTTQVRSQLQSHQARSARRRRLVLGALVVLVAVAGIAGTWWKRDADLAQREAERARADSLQRIKTDSIAKAARVTEAARDSAQKLLDAQRQQDSIKLATVRPPIVPRPLNPASKKAHLEIVGPDSAQLYVDDVPVAMHEYSADVAAGTPVAIRATIPTNVLPCPSAIFKTELTLRAGDKKHLPIDVVPCAALILSIDQKDASFVLQGISFPFDTSAHYDGKPMLLVLRKGNYRLKATAMNCVNYSDSVVVNRNPQTGADTVARSIPMFCH